MLTVSTHDKKFSKGIIQGHTYTFLNATNIHFDGKTERLVQLRNPWAWKGKWGGSDPNWSKVSEE